MIEWIKEWSGVIGIVLGILGIGITLWIAFRRRETNPIWYFIVGAGATLLGWRIGRDSSIRDLDKQDPKYD
jgi:hypothetical protein